LLGWECHCVCVRLREGNCFFTLSAGEYSTTLLMMVTVLYIESSTVAISKQDFLDMERKLLFSWLWYIQCYLFKALNCFKNKFVSRNPAVWHWNWAALNTTEFLTWLGPVISITPCNVKYKCSCSWQ